MKKHICTLLALVMATMNLFAQEPPEYLDFIFKDINGQTVFPDITIIENNVKLDFNEEKLVIQSDTVTINFQDRLNHTAYQYKNDSGDLISRIASIHYDHFLGEEIIMIAQYKEKVMHITFFGQSMRNFGIWQSGFESQKPNVITFQEGTYLYTASGLKINGTTDDTRTLTTWNTQKQIFNTDKTAEGKATWNTSDYDGINNWNELKTLQSILKNNENTYLGFLFQNNVPVAYGYIKDDFHHIIYLNKRMIKQLKKYYH